MNKDIEEYIKVSNELLEVEDTTLDTYIEYLVKLSEMGFGDSPVRGYPNKGALTPFYDKSTDELVFWKETPWIRNHWNLVITPPVRN